MNVTSPDPKPAGIACPKCGGVAWEVLSTRRRPGRLVRLRECKGCKQHVRTCERIEAATATRPRPKAPTN